MQNCSVRHDSLHALALGLLALAITAAPHAAAQASPTSAVIAFDIAAQPMARALQTLAEQADLQILFTVSDVNAFTAPQVSGRMSSEDALKRLLEGTTLECIRNGDVLVIRERAVTKADAQGEGGQGSTLRLAQTESDPRQSPADTQRTEDAARSASSGTAAPAPSDATPLGETVVTGSWIRGAQIASPLTVIERVDIERTGLTTVQQVIERLPQNYGGGDADGTVLSPGGSNLNFGFGSSVNLRGLGSDSTLVLLDGRRLAPATWGQFIDISMIPLTAIERIDILTDGASATYGSDAVAGVVNIRLRDDYEGAETRLKGGTASEGHVDEYQFGQTFGHDWASGNALVTYEYYERGNLDSNERDYSRDVLDYFDLYAEQERQSVLASATQELSETVRLRANALYSERDALWRQANNFTLEPNTSEARNRQVAASLGGSSEFGDSWQAELAATYGRSTAHLYQIDAAGVRPRLQHELDVVSAELTVDGSPLQLRGAPVRLALGAAWRTEGFDPHEADRDRDRDVSAAFLETVIPVLGTATEQRLELSLAARYERYSDFGDSTNPKVGLVWEPTRAVRFRSTWGTSFRAPLFTELDETDNTPVLITFADPSAADGTTLTMLLQGNNIDLQPEEATTFTAGIDLESSDRPDTALSLTYFETRFDDRIIQPLPLAEIFGVFSQADIYASIITRDPDDAFIAELAADPRFQNAYGPFVPSDVEAFVDRRLQNMSRSEVSGIDLSASAGFDTPAGDIHLGLTGTYLLDYTNQISDPAPADDVLDTAYHLIDLKLRASVAWTYGAWGANAYINYADDYTNDTVTPAGQIPSWTTVDLQLNYAAPWFDGVRFALSAQNVFNEDPPSLPSPLPIFNVGYDPTNASPLGRFLSLSVTANW